MDVTGTQMVMTLKLISVAINYWDGGRPDKDLSEWQRSKKLDKLPSFIEFLGYALSPTQILSGPSCEMSDYLDWANSRNFYDFKKSKKESPSPLVPTLKAIFEAVIYVMFFMKFTLPLATMHSDLVWAAKPLYHRLGWLFMFMTAFRCKYYFSWKMAEAAVNASGLGLEKFDEQTGDAVWSRGRNVNVLKVEFAGSAAMLPIHWNICTGNWLRHYVRSSLSLLYFISTLV